MTLQIAAAVLSVLALFAMTFVVRACGKAWAWPAESQRKLVHVGVGIHAMLLPLVLGREGFLVFAALALGALLVLRLPRMASDGAGAAIHSVARRSWGDLLFLVSVAVLFVRAAGEAEFYILPLAVLTLADAAAAVIGTEYGRRHFGSEDRVRSVEGTLAFLVITWMVAVTILIVATAVPRENVVWLATVIAAMAAIIEADSWQGLDNLFIPMGVYTFLLRWGEADPPLLGLASAMWIVVLVGAPWMARPLGLTPHAVRAAFIALFLSAGMLSPFIVVLPVLALAGHIAAKRSSGLGEALRDLDFVVTLVLVEILWLAVGSLTGIPATEFDTMTFSGLAAGYAVLAVPRLSLGGRLALSLAAIGVAVAVHQWVSLAFAAEQVWLPRTVAMVACAGSAAVSAFAAALRPAALVNAETGLKLGVLSLAGPAVAYGLTAFT